jgi:hypothetical protein
MTIKTSIIISCIFLSAICVAQQEQDVTATYKKRVLETTEIDFLSSYYSQTGDNAAVSGGIGSEELTDATATVVISIPLNEDDVLTIDAGVSAYTSASSSNVNPFDGSGPANAFAASSGASGADVWSNITGVYSHSSDDRNTIWSGKVSVSAEYDYFSLGFGGSFTKLFNEKNTELSISANAFLDSWSVITPVELRGPGGGGDDDDDFNINSFTITGNPNYNPNFVPLPTDTRNSYSLGLGFSQILSKKMQGSLALDVVQQNGLLSTPFQRVYFSDIEDSFIEDFHLAEDIERLPDTRFKVAVGGRLNYYINEVVTVRSFYRYYFDDWGITSHTASIEVPVKLGDKFTVYPSYRYYQQTAADYFQPYNQHLSTADFYTSDFDLSTYNSNQFGFGISYTDILTKARIWKIGLKSIDLKFYQYDRDTTFSSTIITTGFKFNID